MGIEEILETLRSLSAEIARDYKAEIVGVFGSYARGEQGADSDLDVLVDFRDKANLLDLVGLGQFLEEILRCKVDVVSRRALRDRIKPNIENDLIPV